MSISFPCPKSLPKFRKEKTITLMPLQSVCLLLNVLCTDFLRDDDSCEFGSFNESVKAVPQSLSHSGKTDGSTEAAKLTQVIMVPSIIEATTGDTTVKVQQIDNYLQITSVFRITDQK